MSSRRFLSGAGFAVFLLTAAGSKELADAGEPGPPQLAELDEHCAHGRRVELQADVGGKEQTRFECECWDGWRTAGITDTLDWIEGSCNQFQCESDRHCQDVLQIPGARCPVRGWNCYCGWRHAMMNGWRGWDPLQDNTQLDGECMGVLYTFSVDATSNLKSFLEHAWKPFIAMAVLFLPFGRKRAVCDHHKPSLWNGIRKCCGCTIECTGGCVMSTIYDLDVFKDDIAWTIWILDVMVWVYLFTLASLISAAWICSMIIWALVLLALMVALIAGVFMMCCAGADGGGAGDCQGCDFCKICECGGADAAGCGGAECGGLCGGGAVEGGAFYEPFYWGGPMPMHTHGCFYSPYYDYGYGYGGGHDCSCCDRRNRCCSFFCKPVALLFYVYPAMPENMWGGLLGYFCMGTHHMTPEHRAYQGGHWLVDRMMGQRPADLHSNEGWRAQVYDFLAMDEADPPRPGGTPTPGEALYQEVPGERDDPNVVRIPGSSHCRAFKIDRPFDKEEHRLWESSFEDYKKNVCWICQGPNDQWDTWMSCRHMFCSTCSTQMLKRRMPCPLCRVSSNTVLRGPKHPSAPDEGASSTEPYTPNSPSHRVQSKPSQEAMRRPRGRSAEGQQRDAASADAHAGGPQPAPERQPSRPTLLYGQRSMLLGPPEWQPVAAGPQRNSRDFPPF